MSIDFAGLSPREIDEAYARARENAEVALLVSTGLQDAADQVNEARKQRESATKRLNRASDDLSAAKETLLSLRDDLEARIRAAFEAGVPKARLLEVSGLSPLALRRVLNAEPNEFARTTELPTNSDAGNGEDSY